MPISFLIPTRKRPDNMRRLAASIYDNAAKPENVELLFYIDVDDIESYEIAGDLMEFYSNCGYIQGPRICLSEIHNTLLRYSKFDDIYCYAGDDNVVLTKGFDKIVYEEFDKYSDKLILLFGDDLFNPNT